VLAASRVAHLQQQRSTDPLLFISDYVQQVAATGKLPLELGGNIHLFRQRWWKGTFVPALLTPPPNGSTLPLAHVKLGELLVDRGMLAAQQVSRVLCDVRCRSRPALTTAQWDDFLVRVRLLAQDHKPPPACPAALQSSVSGGGGRPWLLPSSLPLLMSTGTQPHDMQVTGYLCLLRFRCCV
jgi:hypothetical protein